MRRVAVLFALSLCNCALVAGAPQPPERANHVPVFAVEHIGRGVVPIDGEWQFHLGDDLRWAAPAYDDSEWEHITADKTWGAQSHPSYTGFAWYRRHLDIPPSPLRNAKLAILMPPVEDAYEIFWNGVRIGHQGNPPPHAIWYLEQRQSFALPVHVNRRNGWRAGHPRLDGGTGVLQPRHHWRPDSTALRGQSRQHWPIVSGRGLRGDS